LQERYGEIKLFLNSEIYFKQITTYFTCDSTSGIKLSNEQLQEFYPRFNALVPQLLSSCNNINVGRITVLYIWLRYFKTWVSEECLFETLENIDLLWVADISYKELSYVLVRLDEYDTTKEYIRDNWGDYFTAAVTASTDGDDIRSILGWFEHYEIDNWSSNKSFITELGSQVNQLYTADDIDLSRKHEGIISAYYEGYHSEALRMVEEKISDDYSNFLSDCGLSDFYDEFHKNADYDSQKILDNFVESYQTPEDDYDPGERIQSNSPGLDEDGAIQKLFER
jgi:hypothetical protein